MLDANPTTSRTLDESVLLSKPELVLGRYRLMGANSTGGFGNWGGFGAGRASLEAGRLPVSESV